MLRWRLLTFFLLKFILSVRLKEKSNYTELFISLKKALVRKGKKKENTTEKFNTEQNKNKQQNKPRRGKVTKIVLSTRSSLKQ